jgi:hypothetical protein
MSLLELIDRIMHTTPAPHSPLPPRVNDDRAVWDASRQVTSLRQDLAELDTAVSVAEARLRARGVQLPGDEQS